MFDTYSPTQKVNVNAVSGTLSKTCKDSYFQCCQRGSRKFDDIVNDKANILTFIQPNGVFKAERKK